MNQKVVIHRAGGLGQLLIEESPDPVPGDGQALVRVIAAGAAFGDVLVRRGLGGSFPATPGYDLVGVIEAVGPNVSLVEVGQCVAAMPGTGAQQQLLCLAERELIPVPSGLSPEKAVAVVLNYLTAFQLLTRAAGLKAGDTAFIYGLAGGLGSAMRQVAGQLGIDLYGTASSSRIMEAGRGATVFDRQDPEWVAAARRELPDGFDAVFDPLGGSSLGRSFGLLARRGVLVMLGAATAVQGPGDPRLKIVGTLARLLWLKLRPDARRVLLFMVPDAKKKRPDQFREDLALMLLWLSEGKIDPAIHKILPLAEVRAAHKMLEQSESAGKIVLKP